MAETAKSVDITEGKVAAPPDPWRRYLTRIVVASLLTNIGFGFASPFLPLHIQDIGSFDARRAALWAGIIGSVQGPLSFFAGPMWGVLSDWFGRKLNVIRGAFGAGSVMVLTGVAHSIPQLVVIRASMGVAAGVNPAIMGLGASIAPKKRLPEAVGILQGVSAFGNTIGPFLGGLFVAWAGIRAGFVMSGVILASAGLVVLFGVRESVRAAASAKSLKGFWHEVSSLARSPGVLGALGVLALVQLAPNLYASTVPLFLRSLHPGLGTPIIGLFFTIVGLSTTVAAWTAAALLHRIGFRTLMLGAGLTGMVGVLGLAVSGSVALALACAVPVGLAIGALATGASALVGTVAPKDRQGAAFGVIQAANAVGFGSGPFIGGLAANGFGLRTPFFMAAAAFLVLALITLRFRKDLGAER